MRSRTNTTAALLRTFLAIALLIWATNTLSPGQVNSPEIDTLMHRLAARGQFNGSILVAEHGKIVYRSGFGEADGKLGIPFTPSTPCYLASLTKQFTAMGIMILAEQHRLSYSDPISKYLSELPAYAQKVTIRHLLNHTSGIPDYTGLGLEHPGLTNREVLSNLLHQDSLQFTPGDRFEYSNSGYVLLATIIERISGQPYRVFLKHAIFDPMGMNHTTVYDESRPDIPGRARGYSRFGDDRDYDLLTYGEGGIYSSVEDMFKWDEALYTDDLVRQPALAEAFTRGKLNDHSEVNYGFGWGISEYNQHAVYSHAGRYGGFNTYIKRFPSEHTTILFLTNHDFKNMSAIGNALINIVFGKPYSLPKLSIAELLYRDYHSGGIIPALARYQSLREGHDSTYDYGEPELNELGYELLGMNKTDDAIQILKLNAEEYPDSWNVYDGLGEAYMRDGNSGLAIKNYEKSLEMNPGNSNAKSMLGKLLNH